MTTLAQQFQDLVNNGMVKPSEFAPVFVPLYPIEQTQLRTVYNIGEAMIRNGGAANAKLEPSSKRDNLQKY
jgi:hypothetical protein